MKPQTITQNIWGRDEKFQEIKAFYDALWIKTFYDAFIGKELLNHNLCCFISEISTKNVVLTVYYKQVLIWYI